MNCVLCYKISDFIGTSFAVLSVYIIYISTGWSKSLCAPDDYSTKNTQSPHNWWFEDGHHRIHSEYWTVLYWTRSSRTQFRVSMNVWTLTGDALNITCNFLYCNHQVHREFWSLCIHWLPIMSWSHFLV
jgi:hypothetical protein